MAAASSRQSSFSHPERRAQPPTLADRFVELRRTTERLIEGLSAEDCLVQSMPDASPAKWHLAHTSWFFETFVLAAADERYAPFRPRYGFLFNSYYEAFGPRHARPQRGLLTRPTLAEVLQYRRHVDDTVLELLERRELTTELLQMVELGIHHEQQHQELLLTDIKHAFSLNPLSPAYQAASLAPAAPACPLEFSAVDEGFHDIGAEGQRFAYDNESPRHRAWIERFEIAERTVTNQEMLDFVLCGGYREPRLWLSDGWNEIQRCQTAGPQYWQELDGQMFEFTLSGLVPLDLHAPACHLSYYEADAYATFAGCRLPTEVEWEVAARRSCAAPRGQLLESGRLHPGTPSWRAGRGARAFLGDVWEWTRSAHAPYPGYRRTEGALGEYNGKFMCGQLVLRGGSSVTPESHVRDTYRNFFPPSARWQFSGIRLARDGATP